MIKTKQLLTIADFESLKKGDIIACEFNRDVHDYPKKYRFKVFTVYQNRADLKEIILQKKNNIYFNYEMFVAGESMLESAMIFYQE